VLHNTIGPGWCIINARGEEQMPEFGPRNLGLSEEQIADFCRRWRIHKFALFGSVLRSDLSQDSDLDVLVTFAPDAEWSLLDHVQMGKG
jgi:predicted nucleotidyltransferase